MNSTRTLHWILYGACLLLSTSLRAEILEKDLGAFIRPLDKENKRLFDTPNGVVGEISKTEKFQKWKIFEDDKVKFSYPDHEAITLEVKLDEPVTVDGNRVSNVDTSYTRAYRIVADGTTLLVLILNEADWLDDGVCFCGEVVYERYMLRNGNLYRFSFLDDGILKKMQIQGDGERLMMFEWTHLPMHPAVYRQIARSIELKKSGSWTEDESRRRVFERYGPEGVVGWLDEGSSVESVVNLLGKPNQVKRDGVYIWDYVKREDGYIWKERLLLQFTKGKLVRFGNGYYDSAVSEREAIKWGIPWMIQVAEPYESPLSHGDQAKKMPEKLKSELLALFLEKAEDKESDFNELCRVMKILTEQGVRDEKALNTVRKRFASEEGHYAGWVLHNVGHPEDITLFIKKIRKIYTQAEADPAKDFGGSDLHNWLAFIPDEDKRYAGLLREGLKSPSADVRESAYFFLDSAPFLADESIAFVHTGLKDNSSQVRYWAAQCYSKFKMSDRDWEQLRMVAEQEKDQNTLKKMRELLTKYQTEQPRLKLQKKKTQQ